MLKVKYKLLNAKNYNMPQDRKRAFIVDFQFPNANNETILLKDAIWGLRIKAKPHDSQKLDSFNHEYYKGNFSTIFMSRN